MMRGQANENILTLMASIDRLHSQATRSDFMAGSVIKKQPAKRQPLLTRLLLLPRVIMRLFI